MCHVARQHDLLDALALQMLVQVRVGEAVGRGSAVHAAMSHLSTRLLGACFTIAFSPAAGLRSIQSKLSLSGLKTGAPLPAECWPGSGVSI